jgi:hypothetical protein
MYIELIHLETQMGTQIMFEMGCEGSQLKMIWVPLWLP